MPLKIRCPHCRKTLLADDDTAGEQKLCPACEKVFTVPIPEREAEAIAAGPRDVARECPVCHRDVAHGASYCPHCWHDLATGRRLPLGRRLRLISIRTWTIAAMSAAALGIAAFSGAFYYLHTQPGPVVVEAADEARPRRDLARDVQRLLSSQDAGERAASLRELVQAGSEAHPLLAAALTISLDERMTPWRVAGQLAAIDLLSHSADERWMPALRECLKQEALRDAAMHGLARLGDSSVAERLCAAWNAALKRELFLAGIAAVSTGPQAAAAERLLDSARRRTIAYSDSLRQIASRDDGGSVMERLAAGYWASWTWLGQVQGERYAVALFAVAQPPSEVRMDFEEVKQAIRGARRALDSVAHSGTPLARAAAALTLDQCVPQYRSARGRALTQVAHALGESEGLDQQRLTWALARLSGRTFGQLTGRDHPLDVQPADVAAALAWAESFEGAPRREPPRGGLAAAPRVARRVLSADRQLETELLALLGQGWGQSDLAAERWLLAGLPFTPRLEALLSPSQSEFDRAALLGVMQIAAHRRAIEARRALELWRDAAEQPVWIRGFAALTLLAIDGLPRRGAWPEIFRDPAFAQQLDRGRPGWVHLARVLSAGGEDLLLRLRNDRDASLPPAMRARMVAALEREMRRVRGREEAK